MRWIALYSIDYGFGSPHEDFLGCSRVWRTPARDCRYNPCPSAEDREKCCRRLLQGHPVFGVLMAPWKLSREGPCRGRWAVTMIRYWRAQFWSWSGSRDRLQQLDFYSIALWVIFPREEWQIMSQPQFWNCKHRGSKKNLLAKPNLWAKLWCANLLLFRNHLLDSCTPAQIHTEICWGCVYRGRRG